MHILHICAVSIALASILVNHFMVLLSNQNTSTCPAISNAMIHSVQNHLFMKVTAVICLFFVCLALILQKNKECAFFVLIFLLWTFLIFHPRSSSNSEIRSFTSQRNGIIHNACVLLLFVTWISAVILRIRTWDTFRILLVIATMCTFSVFVVYSLFTHSCEGYENEHHLLGTMEFILLTSLLWLFVESHRS